MYGEDFYCLGSGRRIEAMLCVKEGVRVEESFFFF